MPSLLDQETEFERTPSANLDDALNKQADIAIAKAEAAAAFNPADDDDGDGNDADAASSNAFGKAMIFGTAATAASSVASGDSLWETIKHYGEKKLRNNIIKRSAKKLWEKIRGKGKTASETAEEAAEKGAGKAIEKGAAEAAPTLAEGAIKVGAEVVGRGVEVAYVGYDIYQGTQAVSKGDFREAAGYAGDAGGFLGGAAAGLSGGAALGAALGIESGPGAILTGAVGAIIGGIVGGFVGKKATQAFYDRIKNKLPDWMHSKDSTAGVPTSPLITLTPASLSLQQDIGAHPPAPSSVKQDLQDMGLHTLASYAPASVPPPAQPHGHNYGQLQTPVQIHPGKGPPGIAFNNPGNLRGTDNWQGKLGVGAGNYLVFDTPENGTRATVINALHQQEFNHYDTVQKIIGHWAPESDHNNTAAYVKAVSEYMHVAPDQKIDLHDPATLRALVSGIVRQENGTAGLQKYTPEMISNTVDTALGNKPKIAQMPNPSAPNRAGLRAAQPEVAATPQPARHTVAPHAPFWTHTNAS